MVIYMDYNVYFLGQRDQIHNLNVRLQESEKHFSDLENQVNEILTDFR